LAISFLKEKIAFVEFIGMGLAIIGSLFLSIEKKKPAVPVMDADLKSSQTVVL
jgi:hypothetical protein